MLQSQHSEVLIVAFNASFLRNLITSDKEYANETVSPRINVDNTVDHKNIKHGEEEKVNRSMYIVRICSAKT